MNKSIILEITPVPKPRMNQSDRWNSRRCTEKYWTYKEELKLLWNEQIEAPWHLDFLIPMPKSWSKKKKLKNNLKPHTSRPDVDNLIKGFLDGILEEDKHIFSISASKYWAHEGSIIVSKYIPQSIIDLKESA